MILVVHIENLDGKGVLDPPAGHFLVKVAAIPDDVDFKRFTKDESRAEQGNHGKDRNAVTYRLDPSPCPALARQLVLRGIGNEAVCISHLVHDGITGVHAQGTVDTFVLQPVPDIDAGGTDLHTIGTVDTVPQSGRRLIRTLLARSARLTPFHVV